MRFVAVVRRGWVAARDCVVAARDMVVALRDGVAVCWAALRDGAAVRDTVTPRVVAARDGTDITDCDDVVVRGNTVALVRADTDCVDVVALRVVSRLTTLPSRVDDDCVRVRVVVDGVTFVAREIPDAEFDCVCVVADCVRDTVVVVSRRVAARAAASDESSAYAAYTHMPSAPRQPSKIRLIPVIPLLYM